MKLRNLTVTSLLLATTAISACAKPESTLTGRWASEKTSTAIEFKTDKTGVIHLKSNGNLPAEVPFRWEMTGNGNFRIQMTLPGSSTIRSGNGVLHDNQKMILEDDPFTKIK